MQLRNMCLNYIMLLGPVRWSSWKWERDICVHLPQIELVQRQKSPCELHYDDVIMEAIASQITSLTSVYSTVYSGADQSEHQSSASLAFVWGIHRGPVNSPHKWPVTRKMFPFDDVIMVNGNVSRPSGHCYPAVSVTSVVHRQPGTHFINWHPFF